ncbi:hypothetical protein [Paracoccus sp. IB05]|uniref:hypothetical protein n=1 Tax=Paracoccus sp. IB05 TaxID=2779367 RepID=UPI0018E88EB5|nr:hypothetical protein [Paracoccus sp. IB05]MBJ2150657.1 hypothetical protein [Paracoccus sp. IB05]
MKNYGTARALLGLLGVLGVIAILAGVALIFFGPGRSTIETLTLCIPPIFGGLMMIAVAELGTAQLDTASNTAEIANILRRQEKSQQK